MSCVKNGKIGFAQLHCKCGSGLHLFSASAFLPFFCFFFVSGCGFFVLVVVFVFGVCLVCSLLCAGSPVVVFVVVVVVVVVVVLAVWFRCCFRWLSHLETALRERSTARCRCHSVTGILQKSHGIAFVFFIFFSFGVRVSIRTLTPPRHYIRRIGAGVGPKSRYPTKNIVQENGKEKILDRGEICAANKPTETFVTMSMLATLQTSMNDAPNMSMRNMRNAVESLEDVTGTCFQLPLPWEPLLS